MKRKMFITGLIAGVCLSCTPVYASLNNVNDFLSKYSINENSFYAEEFVGESVGLKSLFVRIAVSASNSEGRTLFISKNDIFLELAKQNWFDYADIYCASFDTDSSILVGFDKYNIENGTVENYDKPSKLPWIIKNQDELDVDTKRYLGRVAQELLKYNIDTRIYLDIGYTTILQHLYRCYFYTQKSAGYCAGAK